MSGFLLSRRATEAILALFGNIPRRKLQLIACIKGSAIISAPILIKFEGIVSTPTPFLTCISFKSFLTFEPLF